MSTKHLIVGLGNPGSKYAQTRHNIGFLVIDELAARHQLGSGRRERRALTWDGSIGGRRVKLAKPLTYMNRSGESLRQLMDYYDIPLEQLLVTHDDLDTPFGILRLRQSGGHGGQNGLRSIIQHLGSRDFARLRFGIGRPPGKMNPVDYVLQKFKGDDAIRAGELTGRAADAIEVWLSDGIERAMSRFNGDAQAAKIPPSKDELKAQLAELLRARELAPLDTRALATLIAIQKKLGQIDAAVHNHLKLARLLEREGQSKLAIAEKVKAVSIRPCLVTEQREIANWHLAQENGKKAVSRMLILAQHFIGIDDHAGAMAEVARALAINPQHPKALAMRQSLEAEAPSPRRGRHTQETHEER